MFSKKVTRLLWNLYFTSINSLIKILNNNFPSDKKISIMPLNKFVNTKNKFLFTLTFAILISITSVAQSVKVYTNTDSFFKENQKMVYQINESENVHSSTNGVENISWEGSKFYIYVADFNGDGKPDALVNMIDEYKHSENGAVLSSLIFYYSNKDEYMKETIPQLNKNGGYNLQLTNVELKNKTTKLFIQDADEGVCRREITLQYNDRNNQFEIIADGGEGVFTPGNSYYILNDLANLPNPFVFNDLNRWDSYYDKYIDYGIFEKEMKTVTVKDYQQFLNALDDYTEIILDMDEINLSSPEFKNALKEIRNKNDLKSRKVSYTMNTYDNVGQPEALILQGFTGLTLKGKKSVNVISTKEEDEIISFKLCKNIRVENLNFYHKVGVDPCSGGVSNVEHSENVVFESCQFNGSGIIGIDIFDSRNITITNSQVYHNSQYALTIYNADNVNISNTNFYKNDVNQEFLYFEKSNVEFTNCRFTDNKAYEGFVNSIDDKTNIQFAGCTFADNDFGKRKSGILPDESGDFKLKKQSIVDIPHNYDEGYDVEEPAIIDTAADESNEPEPATASNTDECTYVSSTDMLRIENENISAQVKQEYCNLLNENYSAVSGIEPISDDPNSNKKMSLIYDLFNWEDAKDLGNVYRLDDFYQFPVAKYWDKTNLSKEQLEKQYQIAFDNVIASANSIQYITQKSENLFQVELKYMFIGKKSKKAQLVRSVINVEFELGKIKKIGIANL